MIVATSPEETIVFLADLGRSSINWGHVYFALIPLCIGIFTMLGGFLWLDQIIAKSLYTPVQDTKRQPVTRVVTSSALIIFGIMILVMSLQNSHKDENFKLAIERGDTEVLEGAVTNIVRYESKNGSTFRPDSRRRWHYRAIYVGSSKFLLTHNHMPHYGYDAAPVMPGDFVRITHVNGRPIKITKLAR